MKLTNLQIKNFLGARAVDIGLTKPVTIFAGPNGAGKSSIQEAVRMALTGETVRVAQKKDYAKLVTKGQESGFIEVSTKECGVYSMVLPQGKGVNFADEKGSINYVLNAQRFASLDNKERRSFLFGLMGLSAGVTEVRRRLIDKDCVEWRVDTITPLLRSGFDAAHKEAQAKARDEKAGWRTLTGETYGEKRAETWKAVKPEFSTDELIRLREELGAIDAAIASANQRIGSMRADKKSQIDFENQTASLRQKVSNLDRIKKKLEVDTMDRDNWQAKVDEAKKNLAGHTASGLKKLDDCPNCGTAVRWDKNKLVIFKEDAIQVDQGVLANLPKYEESLRLIQSCVEKGMHDLYEAEAAEKALAQMNAVLAPSDEEISEEQKHIDSLSADKKSIASKLEELQEAERKAKRADEVTQKALEAHQSVIEWNAIADALAPDGIPGEMLSEALNPLNNRLQQSSLNAEWPCVKIDAEMNIVCGDQEYALLSESEKWRADAMIAEAVSYLSGLKILVLDRFDVLDLGGREDLLYWLENLTEYGEIDTALIFGTLKALPAGLSYSFVSHWVENGVCGKLREVA